MKDSENKNIYNFTYFFEDITKKNSSYLDSQNYKLNLNKLFNLTQTFMLKENYIKNGEFKDILNFIKNNMNNSIENENKLRNLKEVDDVTTTNAVFGINTINIVRVKKVSK